MRKLGQHFLKNRSVTNKIIAALRLVRDDFVLEVGSGHGELTIPLALVGEGSQYHLVAVEKDEALAKELGLRIAALPKDKNRVDIVAGDILAYLASPHGSLALNERPFKLVGNLPYYITGRLLRMIGELKNKPTRSVIMVQKEVAERIVAKPPKMNRLAASVQYWADPAIVSIISKQNFNPPPKVDSALVILEARSMPPIDAARYFPAIRALFAQPRKTVLNNLAAHMGKENSLALLREIKINPEARPQNLSIKDIAGVAAHWG